MTNMGIRDKSRLCRIIVVGVLVATASTATVAFVHSRQISARVPPSDASLEEVLRAYLRAAKDHDCAVTEALSVSEGDERALAWCGGQTESIFNTHPDLISYKHIGVPTAGPSFGASQLAERCYPVDITETNMTGAEPGTMPGWQFCFAKTPSGWRLADQGYG